jgi:hypothetical protein
MTPVSANIPEVSVRGVMVKFFVGILLLSFPGALYFLYIADIGKFHPERTDVREIALALEQKERDIAALDDKIIQARGEMMKFEDMKKSVVSDLIVLKNKISEVIDRTGAAGQQESGAVP